MKNYADYYHHMVSLWKSLQKEIPQSADLLNKLNLRSKSSGSLSIKHKALMALSIAINNQSEEQMAINLHDALKAGASKSEITETMELCAAMGGQSVLLFACSAYAAMIQLEEDTDEFRDSFYS